MQKMNVDNISRIVSVGCRLANVAGDVLDDGKITAGDFLKFWEAGKILWDIRGVDFRELMPEFKDLDQNEVEYLVKKIEDNLSLPHDTVEKRIKGIFEIGGNFYKMVNHAISLWAKN